MVGMEGVARKAVEAPPSPVVKMGEPVKIQIRTPEQPQPQPISANDNFPSQQGLVERGTEKARSFVYERIAKLPEGRLKNWCVNKAVDRYSQSIDKAQADANIANAQFSALSSNNPAEMERALQAQNNAVSKINQMAQWRGKYAGMLKSHFEGKLGKENDPNSALGMVRFLENKVKDRATDIRALEQELQVNEASLDVFKQAQALLVERRAYGSPTEQAKSVETLGTLLKKIEESKGRLSAMINVQQSESERLNALQTSNNSVAATLKHWSSVSENGRHGTSAAERVLVSSKPNPEIAPEPTRSAVQDSSQSPTESQETALPKEANEDAEKISKLARAAELLLKELQSQELREGLRNNLKSIVGSERLDDKIPAAALVNLWNAYSKQERLDKKQSQEIINNNKNGISLEDFGIELANRTEIPHNKVTDGMENVALALKEKLEVAQKAA